MSDQTSVSITSDHRRHRLVIDGDDVSRDVTDVGVSISAGDYPKVDVTFARPSVDLDLSSADVEVNVTAMQRRLLVAAGWSPPTTESQPQPGAVDAGLARVIAARETFRAARAALRTELESNCPGPHEPVQHRDRRPPWCDTCGYTSDGVYRPTPEKTP